MTEPRPSIFRDALQVSPARIAAMDDAELGELMREILRAQAHLCGSSLAKMRVNAEDKAGDDGCDGWTAKPRSIDTWLGDSDTCWQFKAGTNGQPARLKGEVTKHIPKRTLEANGRFVIIASGSTSGIKGEEARLEVIREEAAAAGIPTERIIVIGSEALTEWCNQNPAIASRWSGRPAGMCSLADWSNMQVHQVPWQASDDVVSDLETQRKALDFEGDSVEHVHIYGQPGVGKTRFALELCREAPWSGFVIYVSQAKDLRLLELIDSAADDPGVRLVVVADEVQPEQLLPLRDSIGRGNGRIRLITIGHCVTLDPTRIPALVVAPLEPKIASQVVKGWYPGMPREHIDFVVRFADGYVRLAKLAADAVARDANVDVRRLLSREEIRGFMDSMLGNGDRRSLHVVAVLSSVGWTDDMQAEGIAVASHLGLDWNDVRARVEVYHQQFGIAPRGGRRRYISPSPLGIYLAVEAWTAYPDLLRTLADALPTEGAKDAYYERLRSMASNPQAKKYARDELGFFFQLSDFVDERAVRRWSALSTADPDQAAHNILQALQSSSIPDRLRIEGRARREVVWTLIRLAWRTGAFADAVKSLALLAEAENETWSNNATSEFENRFQVFLGGTAVPYLDRLTVLDELVGENRTSLNRLAIQALARVGDEQAFRVNNPPPSDELPEEEWHPSTRGEHIQCIEAALDRLTTLADLAQPELQEDIVAAAKNVSMMLREESARSLIERFFEVARHSYPEAREPLRRVIGDVVHRERKYWKQLSGEEIAELDSLHARFEDSSLKARLRQHVGQAHWEREEEPDLRPLAKEFLESEGLSSYEWTWLMSGDAADSWRFGEALAEVDSERTLAVSISSLSDAGRDLRVLCGYLYVLRKRLGDDWYEEWIEDQLQRKPRPIKLLFEAVWRCGATPGVAHLVADVLCTDSVAPEIVGQLGFTKWTEALEPTPLVEVIRAMIDNSHSATALAILEHRLEYAEAEFDIWRNLVRELVMTPELIRSGHMTSYYWKELAMRLVKDHPGEIAAAIFREQGDRSDETWFAEHSKAAKVLEACVEEDPAAVWSALVPQLSSKRDAYRFSTGFPRTVVDHVPAKQVLDWVEEDPEERAAIIAKLTSNDLSDDETLAARVLGSYGDRKDVANAFFADYVSGIWWGPASTHWEQLREALDKVAKQTKRPKLRTWAIDSVRHLKRMAEQDRQREEEEDLRGYQ